MPRKTTYTQALADEICHLVSEGRPLKTFCREKGLPWRTVYDWIKDRPEFAERYQQARDIGMDAIAEDILEIADDGRNDWMERFSKDDKVIGWVVNGEAVARSRLRAEMRLKLLAKWNPKKYGDSMTHRGDPAAPLPLVLNGSDVHG